MANKRIGVWPIAALLRGQKQQVVHGSDARLRFDLAVAMDIPLRGISHVASSRTGQEEMRAASHHTHGMML